MSRETVPVATGSMLLGQVHGGGEVPRLAIDATREDFTAIDKQNFRIERKLTDGKELSLHQGGSLLGRWPIEIVPDNPPTIAFADPPAATPRAALRIDYRAADDYGVASAKAVIRRPDAECRAIRLGRDDRTRSAAAGAEPERGGRRRATMT